MDDDEASELQVVQDEIELETLSADPEWKLAADEREADAHLDEKTAESLR
jgi:hypothetical protein